MSRPNTQPLWPRGCFPSVLCDTADPKRERFSRWNSSNHRTLKSRVLSLPGCGSQKDSKMEARLRVLWLALTLVETGRRNISSLKKLRAILETVSHETVTSALQLQGIGFCPQFEWVELGSSQRSFAQEPRRPTLWLQPSETLSREPRQACLDVWPPEPWVYKWGLSSAPKFVVIFYIAIENRYNQEIRDRNI